jgi:sulfotransferase family protein
MPNLATTRAIVWRRLAALRRRLTPERRAPLRSEPLPGVAAPVAGQIPAPLLVDYFGRDGSTALLRLLSTSAAVHVEGRYPYEDDSLQRALTASDPVAEWSRRCAARFAPAEPVPRWYAEKAIDVRRLDLSPFAEAHVIALLRDPRDTWVSIEAFSRAVGAAEIGGSGSRTDRLDRFVERQRERLRWIAALASEDARVVRYDDLVTDPGAVAAELSGWLGVDFDAAGLAGDFRLRWVHATSRDPARSVGRWRNELDEADLAAIRAGLDEPMATLGFSGWSRS